MWVWGAALLVHLKPVPGGTWVPQDEHGDGPHVETALQHSLKRRKCFDSFFFFPYMPTDFGSLDFPTLYSLPSWPLS